jgi:hypothetical protein
MINGVITGLLPNVRPSTLATLRHALTVRGARRTFGAQIISVIF